MYNSFELFFSGASVHGGGGWNAQRLFCLWVDWLIDFFEVREKTMCQMWVDCKKCDRKKQQQGGLRGGRQKDCASPEERGVRIFACRGFCPGGAARNELSGET